MLYGYSLWPVCTHHSYGSSIPPAVCLGLICCCVCAQLFAVRQRHRLFALPAIPTGAPAFANPSRFELDRAGECATAMASSGDPRMAQGSNRPRMHYQLIVRPRPLQYKKPSKHIGNLLDFKENLVSTRFSEFLD